jgi:DNA-binding MarR family transcriptional regulator
MQESITSYLDESISLSLVRLCKAQRQQSEIQCQQIGLHAGQDLVILRLMEQDGLSQSELAARLGVEIATVAKMVQRMEKEGLLIRRQDVEDARISRVYLTEKGQALGEISHTTDFPAKMNHLVSFFFFCYYAGIAINCFSEEL